MMRQRLGFNPRDKASAVAVDLIIAAVLIGMLAGGLVMAFAAIAITSAWVTPVAIFGILIIFASGVGIGILLATHAIKKGSAHERPPSPPYA